MPHSTEDPAVEHGTQELPIDEFAAERPVGRNPEHTWLASKDRMPPSVREQVAAFVRTARAATGKTQKDFAALVGMHPQTITMLETGAPSVRISLTRLDQIARASGKKGLRLSFGD